MAKVVTESPRYGHENASRKWGRRLRLQEYDADDHLPGHASMARNREYGWRAKSFTDVLGPLRRYLHKQIGRPWDDVWSEITQVLDNRSLTGRHIFSHLRWEVQQQTFLGVDRQVFGKDIVFAASQELRAFGVRASTPDEIRCFRIDGLRLWQRRCGAWFIHTYRKVPPEVTGLFVRYDGSTVEIRNHGRYEHLATKQANKKEIRQAQALLQRDPLWGP